MKYRCAIIASADDHLEERRAPAEGAIDPRLLQAPELRIMLETLFAALYESWLDAVNPELRHQTPLEAVKSLAGRKKVEALVVHLELSSARVGLGPGPEVFQRLRERLGLTPPKRVH